MDFKLSRKYLLNKKESVEDFPFGEDVHVYKVCKKMFATLAKGKMGKGKDHYWMNLKCDPDEAFHLRGIFESVIPGYHMNKTHWNTIILDGSIPKGEIERMMDNSYNLVVKSLTKAQRQRLELLNSVV